MADGSITIECLAKTDKFDKQMMQIQKKIDDKEKEKVDIEADIKNYEKILYEYDQLGDKAAEYEQQLEDLKRKAEELSQASHEPGGASILGDLEQTKNSITDIEGAYNGVVNQIEQQAPAMEKVESKVGNLKTKLQENTQETENLKNKMEGVKLEKQTKEAEDFKSSLKGVGKELGNQIASVGKLALALFAVRSAYMMIRQASSTIAQYDEQYAANLEYIKYALAMVLKPILEYIVNLVATLLQYVNYLASVWFGLTGGLFKSADAFKSAKNSMGGMAKSAKEINKQLAGFDEMNILQDNSSAGGGGGGGGAAGPSFDLSGMQGEVPGWIKWISENGDLVIGLITGIGGALIALKLGLDPLQGAGIGLMLAGVVLLIQDILAFLQDPTWENFKSLIDDFLIDIGLIVAGIGLLTGNWIPVLIGVIMMLVGEVVRHWDDIKKALSEVGQWIYDNIIKPIQEKFQKLWEKLQEIFSPVIEFFKNTWNTVWENTKIGFDNIVKIFTYVWNKLKEIFGPIVEFLKEKFTAAYNKIKEIFGPIVEFFSGIWTKIKSKLVDVVTKIGEAISGAFKGIINAIIGAIEAILNKPIRDINGLIGILNNIPGLNLSYLHTFSFPRLATGGIVNYPNRGVGIGGALAGESGAEGVIPLTDSQAMATLGEAIGRYITINANIVNSMNGRILSREIKRISGQQAYASNM